MTRDEKHKKLLPQSKFLIFQNIILSEKKSVWKENLHVELRLGQ